MTADTKATEETLKKIEFLQAFFEDANCKIRHRRRTQPGQRCHETRGGEHSSGTKPTGIRKASKPMNLTFNDENKHCSRRAEGETPRKRYAKLRSCHSNKDDSGSQNILVA